MMRVCVIMRHIATLAAAIVCQSAANATPITFDLQGVTVQFPGVIGTNILTGSFSCETADCNIIDSVDISISGAPITIASSLVSPDTYTEVNTEICMCVGLNVATSGFGATDASGQSALAIAFLDPYFGLYEPLHITSIAVAACSTTQCFSTEGELLVAVCAYPTITCFDPNGAEIPGTTADLGEITCVDACYYFSQSVPGPIVGGGFLGIALSMGGLLVWFLWNFQCSYLLSINAFVRRLHL
jgi:hypothetical protein